VDEMEKEKILEKLKISPEEFERRIDEMQSHFENLLSDEALFLLAAYSFGYEPTYSIEELVDKKGKVVVEGVVESILSFREFRKENGVGQVALIVLKDKSARIKVVLWNGAAQLVKAGDVVKGTLLRIKGFVKKREEVELSVGEASDVEILERGWELIRGVLVGKAWRQNMAKAVVANESEVVMCVAWDEKAEELFKVEIGKSIELRGTTKDGEFVVSQVRAVEEKIPFKLSFSSISRIIPLQNVNLRGRISGFGNIRKARGKKVAELYISDDTGRIKLLLWDENISIYKKADVGDWIEIFNGFPKIGWQGEVEVHCGWNCIITLKKP
jgi:replication factor A1